MTLKSFCLLSYSYVETVSQGMEGIGDCIINLRFPSIALADACACSQRNESKQFNRFTLISFYNRNRVFKIQNLLMAEIFRVKTYLSDSLTICEQLKVN